MVIAALFNQDLHGLFSDPGQGLKAVNWDQSIYPTGGPT
jgi:hypothetical protein